MCWGLDWCMDDVYDMLPPNGDPERDLKDYIESARATLVYWLHIHSVRDAWVHNWIVDSPEYTLEIAREDGIGNGHFHFDLMGSLHRQWAEQWVSEFCGSCMGEIGYSCECEEPTEAEIDDLIWWIGDVGLSGSQITEEMIINALREAFDVYREAVEPLTASIEEDIKQALEEYDAAQGDPMLLAEWIAWVNHLMHVSGNILCDYGDQFGIEYQQVEHISDGLETWFGREEMNEFFESFRELA